MFALSSFLLAFVCLAHSSRYNGYYARRNQEGKSFEKLWVLLIHCVQNPGNFGLKSNGSVHFGSVPLKYLEPLQR